MNRRKALAKLQRLSLDDLRKEHYATETGDSECNPGPYITLLRGEFERRDPAGLRAALLEIERERTEHNQRARAAWLTKGGSSA